MLLCKIYCQLICFFLVFFRYICKDKFRRPFMDIFFQYRIRRFYFFSRTHVCRFPIVFYFVKICISEYNKILVFSLFECTDQTRSLGACNRPYRIISLVLHCIKVKQWLSDMQIRMYHQLIVINWFRLCSLILLIHDINFLSVLVKIQMLFRFFSDCLL